MAQTKKEKSKEKKNKVREAYDQNQKEISAIIELISRELAKEKEEAKQEMNWGWVGSSGHVRHELADVLKFVKNTDDEAAVEKEIEKEITGELNADKKEASAVRSANNE